MKNLLAILASLSVVIFTTIACSGGGGGGGGQATLRPWPHVVSNSMIACGFDSETYLGAIEFHPDVDGDGYYETPTYVQQDRGVCAPWIAGPTMDAQGYAGLAGDCWDGNENSQTNCISELSIGYSNYPHWYNGTN